MKLYLSSYRLGNNPQLLVDLVSKNKRVAIIPNALDFSTDSKRVNAGINREKDDMKKLGFQPEEFDLKNYFGKPRKFEKDISLYGLLWIIGGNVFLLIKAMRQSGMDKWLIKQKNNNKLVYAGYSAGVCVLSPSLKGLEIVDKPVKVKGYPSKTIWDGIGIINWSFAPHYKSKHIESEKVNNLIEYYTNNKIFYKALSDGEVIIEK